MICIQSSVVELPDHFRGESAKCGIVGVCGNSVKTVPNRLPAPKHSNGFKRFTVPVSHKSPNVVYTPITVYASWNRGV